MNILSAHCKGTGYSGIREKTLEIGHNTSKLTAFVCRERNNQFPVQVMVVKEREHDLGEGVPPYWRSYKDGFILLKAVNPSLIGRLLARLKLLFSQFGEVSI